MDWTNPHAARLVLAKNVRRLRRAKGISQEELAALTQLRQAHISEIESGRSNLTIDRVQSIAVAFGISPRDLVDEKMRVKRR
jgi:transcriptional regulator with XRE-family HTH domain